MQSEITIRDATLEDRDFVLNTVHRLAYYGTPAWRTIQEIVTQEQRGLQNFFSLPEPGAALFVAERHGEGRVGYVFLEVREDYFTERPVGHINSIAVIENADGQGVGSALMRAAEDWARENGFSHLSLNVFPDNYRARKIYESRNFRVETVHYVKILTETGE